MADSTNEATSATATAEGNDDLAMADTETSYATIKEECVFDFMPENDDPTRFFSLQGGKVTETTNGKSNIV